MERGRPQHGRYDVVVVGAGLGGLSAAAALAGAGRHVVVIDRQTGPGGYAHAFTRGPYTFDPAVHVIGQGRPGQFLHSYLHVLGVGQEVTLLPLDHLYVADYPGMRLHAPHGLEEFVAVHARHFPHEAEGIASFMRLAAQVTHESQQLSPRLSLRELDEAVRQFPTLFRYRTALLGDILAEHLKDPRARAAVTSMWPYVGVTPSQVPFVGFCAVLVGILQGLAYCQGTFQRLADAFVTALRRSGGDVVLGREVTRIAVADGRVTGVVLDDGSRLDADAVVSNADARHTLEQLVGTEQLPERYTRSLARMKPSLSAFVLYIATDLDLSRADLGHELFVFNHWDHDATYADIMAGRVGGMWVSLPTLIDPSLAPAGDHLVICSTLAPYDIGVDWQTDGAQRYERSMLDILEERLLPGLRERVKFSERATPLAFERYTLNHRGAIYGWDHIPSQSTPKRLPHRTPIDGLWLAGHWTEPGCSSFRVIYSGFQTAQLMLGLDDPGQLMEKLASVRTAAGN